MNTKKKMENRGWKVACSLVAMLLSLILCPAPASAGNAVIVLTDAQSNPLAGEVAVLSFLSAPQSQFGGTAVSWRNQFTADQTGTIYLTNAAPGKWEVNPVDLNAVSYTFYMPATNGTIYVSYWTTASAGNTLPPGTMSYDVNASDLRYLQPGGTISNAQAVIGPQAAILANAVTNMEVGVSLSNLTVNGASPITGSSGAYFPTGTLTNSYLITASPFLWLNIPVYWNQFLSTNYGAWVYTNTAANGLPVFLAYNDPALAGGVNNINEYWDISTNFNIGLLPLYVNRYSAQDNNSDLTNLLGSVWQFYPAAIPASVSVLAQQPSPVYRLFMFDSTASVATNQVLAFAGPSPLNLSAAGVVFTDTNFALNPVVRDVCHIAYTDNAGKTTYLLAWSHLNVSQGMGLATSPDDVNYTFFSYVPLSCSPNFSNQACWSPKLFVNATNGLEVTALLGPTNSAATPTNIFVGELNPITFTNASVMRVLTTDANIGGAAMVYSQGLYYYYSSSGVVWTNTTLTSTGWKSSWTNGTTMIGGTVCSYAGALYWFSTFGGGSITYSTATNYAGPWSAPVALAFPQQDYAQGDGTFLQLSTPIQGAILSQANGTLTGNFHGTFAGDDSGGTNQNVAKLSSGNTSPSNNWTGTFTGTATGLTGIPGTNLVSQFVTLHANANTTNYNIGMSQNGYCLIQMTNAICITNFYAINGALSGYIAISNGTASGTNIYITAAAHPCGPLSTNTYFCPQGKVTDLTISFPPGTTNFYNGVTQIQ